MASSTRSKMLRVTGVPLDKAEDDIQAAIYDLLTDDEKNKLELIVSCIPSCDDSGTLSALVECKGGLPEFLSHLKSNPLGDWQIVMGDDDISFDLHFFGFTQLYPTPPEHSITADILCLTGLDGHAFGSWRGKGNLGRMWLRDFLSRDLPNCRTMTYGYNSKLFSRGVDTIMDYGRELLEGIKQIRHTQELRERPLFFICHSFGGIILAHCLVKAVQADERNHVTIAALYKATYGILFFGTPHKGLLIDDIQRMVAGEVQYPRMDLLKQIEQKSDMLLYQLVDFKNLIRDRKIISFYETQQTRRLELGETGSWNRTGAYMTAVESGSALLELPDSIETKIPVNADHSQIVKFDNRNDSGYKAAIGYLKEFEQDAGKVVASRFSPILREKIPRSNVPFQRDLKFVGRQDIFTALELQLPHTNSHNRAVLAGLGGVGKSQIAIEYSYRLIARDPRIWVFWVYASTAERFEQAYRSIAIELDLPGSNDPMTDVLGLVARWLSDIDNGRWLMILDNADNIDIFRQKSKERTTLSLSSYVPQTATGSVLLTTRDQKAATWLSTGYPSMVHVDLMDPKEAEQLLYINIPDGLSNYSDCAELARELGYLPLAITQAAAYISAKAVRMDASKYLALYRQDENSQSRLLDAESGDLRRDPGVPNSVIRTWQISFNQIKQSQPKAANLLSLMAMLNRQNIPEFLLSVQYPHGLDLENALDSLNEFSLITMEKGGKTFGMHRLVQLATRKWLELYGKIAKWQQKAMRIVSKNFPSGKYDTWKTCEVLSPHTLEVLKSEQKSNQYLKNRAWLLYNKARYSHLQGDYRIAYIEGQESLTIWEELQNNVRILNGIAMLALVLRAQGKYNMAETMSRRVLAGCETTLGPEHPDTLVSVSNLASVLQNQGKYNEAERMNRRVLAEYETTLGPGHLYTLMSVSNLALVLRNQGKYNEAERMNRRVMAGCETTLGPEHPDTLISVNNLATVLRNQGKYDEAEIMNRQALAGRETTLGPEHPDTLMSISNLALVLQNQGKYDEAEIMNRRVLAGRETMLGPEHPDTLISVSNLASVLRDRGKYSEAEIMNRQAFAGHEIALASATDMSE